MIERDRSRWFIVGVLFVRLSFIWGPVNAGGVFFLPLLRSFGWSRAQLAALGGIVAIAGGVSGPFVGWLIDRAGVRSMMIGGATAIVLCDLALSRANSLAAFVMILNGALATAEQVLREASDQPTPRRDFLALRAELRLIQGQTELAEADFREVLVIARSMDAKGLQLQGTMSLARLLDKTGRRDEARSMLAEIYGWFTEGCDTADLKDGKALLEKLGA